MDEALQCPICHVALAAGRDFQSCPTCGGAFIAEPQLKAMIWETHGGLETAPIRWVPRVAAAGEPMRACPACAQPMGPTSLEDVAVERCLIHGVWLDGGELAQTIQHAAERPVNLVPGQKRKMSLWYAIKMMFTETEAERKDREERDGTDRRPNETESEFRRRRERERGF